MSIRSIRKGFFYQDLYAINQCLKYYLERNLQSIFVDYEYDRTRQKSFDIKIITRQQVSEQPLELIYEVKTGNTFRTTSELITDAFDDLIASRKSGVINGASRSYLVVSPDFKHQIIEFWSNLGCLHRYATLRTQAAQQAMQFFVDNLPIALYDNSEDLHDSLRQVLLIPGVTADTNIGEDLSPLEQEIIGQIRSLAANLSIRYPNGVVFEEKVLLHQLIYAIQVFAGTNVDLIPTFKEYMIDFFTRYSMSTGEITPGTAGTLVTTRSGIEQRMNSFESIELPEQPELSATVVVEGNVVTGVVDE